MKVGFVTRHGPNEAAAVAASIGLRASELGFVPDVLTLTDPIHVDPWWDGKLVDGCDPSDWLKTMAMSHIVFADTPEIEWIHEAKAARVKTYIIFMWEVSDPRLLQALPQVDGVICPNRASLKHAVERYRITNQIDVPWEPGIPITHDNRDVDTRNVKICWPVDDRYGDIFSACLYYVLESCEHVQFEITYTGVTKASKEIRNLCREFPGRVNTWPDLTWDQQRLMMGRCDLTVWPNVSTSAGVDALNSIFMGTPVFAYEHPVLLDFLDEKNSILVPCTFGHNLSGIPYVIPDYHLMSMKLTELVLKPDRIKSLRKTTTEGLIERRKNFRKSIDRLFE